MTNVLILGANGPLARNTTRVFLRDSNAKLTLYLRRANRLKNPDPTRVTIVEGDVLELSTLTAAMKGRDVVYANLAGDMKAQAERIVDAMHAAAVKRLVFVASVGIYGEIPGQRYSSVLDPYRDSAAVIEASDLDYTILRPGWFTNDDEVHYELTQKGQPFKGHDVSLNSLCHPTRALDLDQGSSRIIVCAMVTARSVSRTPSGRRLVEQTRCWEAQFEDRASCSLRRFG